MAYHHPSIQVAITWGIPAILENIQISDVGYIPVQVWLMIHPHICSIIHSMVY